MTNSIGNGKSAEVERLEGALKEAIKRAEAAEAATADWRQVMVDREVRAAMADHHRMVEELETRLDEARGDRNSAEAKLAVLYTALQAQRKAEVEVEMHEMDWKHDERQRAIKSLEEAETHLDTVFTNLSPAVEEYTAKMRREGLQMAADMCDHVAADSSLLLHKDVTRLAKILSQQFQALANPRKSDLMTPKRTFRDWSVGDACEVRVKEGAQYVWYPGTVTFLSSHSTGDRLQVTYYYEPVKSDMYRVVRGCDLAVELREPTKCQKLSCHGFRTKYVDSTRF